MAPVSIHTAPPAKTTYIRIVRSENMLVSAKEYIGRVGILTSVSKNEALAYGDLYFIDMTGELMLQAFDEINVEEISKKEYFKGCLGGK